MPKLYESAWVSIENMDPRDKTEKQLLCLDDEGNEFWVPHSIIHESSPVANVDSVRGTLIVPSWFARVENLPNPVPYDHDEIL